MKKLLIVIGAVVGAVVVAGGAAMFVAMGGFGSKHHKAAAVAPAPALVLMNGGSFTTNLADNGGQNFIKVDLTLGLSDTGAEKALKAQSVAMQNAILYCLRAQSYAEVSGSTGMSHLATVITQALNPLAAPGRVVKVYFTNFVDQ